MTFSAIDTTHLKAFFNFAQRQRPEKPYDSLNPATCALAEYGKLILGDDFSWAMFTYFAGKTEGKIELIPEYHPLAYPLMQAVMYSRNWGQLVDALRQIVKEAQSV